MSLDDVLSEVLIDGAGFITGDPASVDEFKSLVLHKLLKPLLGILVLQVPPSLKEPDLGVSEPRLGVLLQIVKDTSEHSVDCAVKVLIGRAKPTGVLVRVRHDMVSPIAWLVYWRPLLLDCDA